MRGNVELLAPAQWSLTGLVSLSPDGRFVVLQRTINQINEAIVWNMHTRQLWVLPIHLIEVRWINPTQFLSYSTHNLQYHVVDVTTTNTTVFPSIDTRQLPTTTWRSHVRTQWQQAEALYMMVRFGMAGYTILTQESGQYYVYWGFPGTDADVENLLEGFEYHFLSAYARPIVQLTNDQLPSPHQPWYVTREVWNVNERIAIYSTEGRLLAEAYKPGWDPYVLGWSHDGGSVYIQFRRSGAAAAVLQQWHLSLSSRHSRQPKHSGNGYSGSVLW
ncbi:MAG: hypothetical protein GFH27_549281n51 [Chloroflexi bacterium AL-W]|nr:hypothetical protein [Chloroflexi bacterium AL-N1]NOK65937.1 hypothetical protein [Chloroflexi bacterium AL-N10]NOK72818.1 hypothetical protein [Chloroflexi bacterium AL-N5]NOK79715.1 hypothetical protein [Chloroflexi bacterium AL-W]NOK88429.1 hypothetical protein [Chloroflexi bacterium AL-N15]